MPCNRASLSHDEYVPVLCTHRPSLQLTNKSIIEKESLRGKHLWWVVIFALNAFYLNFLKSLYLEDEEIGRASCRERV